MKTQYLINETPLMVLPSLMKAFNGNYTKALILQQIHFMCSWPKSGVEHDGERWVWFTYEEFAEQYMPWTTGRNVRQNVRELEKDGLILSTTRIRDSWDNTKFYRVDESAILRMVNGSTQDVGYDKQAEVTLECHFEAAPECQVKAAPECQVLYTDQSSEQSPQLDTPRQETQSKAAGDGGDLSFPDVVKAYENNIGLLTPISSGMLADDVIEYGAPWVVDAIAIAVKNGKRNLSYIEGILRRWHADGREDKPTSAPVAEGVVAGVVWD